MPTKKTTASKSKTNQSKSSATKKAASPKKRTASKSAKSNAGDQEVTIDRRRQVADRRDETLEQTASDTQVEKRAKVQRRRQIDPTTCERDYSEAEVEFMNAMDEYKRTSGRMFPTCSEVLEVIRGLGYVQLTPAEVAVIRPSVSEESSADEIATSTFDDVEHEEEQLAF